MDAGRRFLFVLKLCLVLLLGAASGSTMSCQSFGTKGPETGNTNGGLILVDTPEVYARERLIRDRNRQKEWLEEQLAISEERFDVFDALVQNRTSQTRTFGLGIDATPSAGAVVADAEAAIHEQQRATEIAELEHQIRLAELQRNLALVEEGQSPISYIAAPTEAEQGSDEGDGDQAGDEESESAAGGGAGGGSSSSSSVAAPTPSSTSPPAVGLADNSAKDTPTSRLLDKLAYREIVRQELLENELDDAHDLYGNTLYRLTFDTTVLPASDTSAWAIVSLKVATNHCKPQEPQTTASSAQEAQTPLTPEDERAFENLRARWLGEVRASLEAQTVELASILLSDQEHQPVDQEHQPVGEQAILLAAAELELKSIKGGTDKLSDPEKRAAARTVAKHFNEGIPESLQLKAEADATQVKISLADSRVVTRESFCDLWRKLPSKTFAYAVTPKEEVQRVSNTTAALAAQQAGLALSAALGTTGVDAALEAAQAAEYQAQSILRQPVVVGFSEGGSDTRFGWILGPKFRQRSEAGFDFRHTAIQRPLSAVVSVPAWWPSITLELKTCWVEGDIQGTGTDVLTELTCNADNIQTGSMTVPLPGDTQALTNALKPQNRAPKPRLVGKPEFQIGRPERLLIWGDNLWRNPIVYAGTQQAQRVEILPDMRGLSVEFSKISQPAGWTPEETDKPLDPVEIWVWTSEGRASAGEVKLHKPAKKPAKDAPKVLFKVEHSAAGIVATKGEGSFSLKFTLPDKPPVTAVGKVFIELQGADINPETTSGPCLVKEPVLSVAGSCKVELGLRNLIPGRKVTVVTYRKDGDKMIHHPPITLKVELAK